MNLAGNTMYLPTAEADNTSFSAPLAGKATCVHDQDSGSNACFRDFASRASDTKGQDHGH